MSTCFDNGQRCVLVDNGYGDECMYCGDKPQEPKMGCDIHVYRERRIDGIWETDTLVEKEDDTYSSYESGVGYVSRSYVMFGALSGVRSDSPIKPPAEDRGFPEDATDINQACSDQMDADGHSHGWLDMAELSKLIRDHEEAIVLYEDHEFSEYAQVNLRDLQEQAGKGDYFAGLAPEDCRILFFYDN